MIPCPMSINILLVDDHQVVREGLRALLEREGFEIVGEADNGYRAIELAGELTPQIALLDFDMPKMNGIVAAQHLLAASPATRLLLLTMYTDRQYVTSALRAGVHGFVIKTQAASDLVHAIRVVHAGERYLSPGIAATLVDAFAHPDGTTARSLTPREQQVLQISVKTAESHRTRIMAKLDIHDTASLVRYAIREGFIRP